MMNVAERELSSWNATFAKIANASAAAHKYKCASDETERKVRLSQHSAKNPRYTEHGPQKPLNPLRTCVKERKRVSLLPDNNGQCMIHKLAKHRNEKDVIVAECRPSLIETNLRAECVCECHWNQQIMRALYLIASTLIHFNHIKFHQNNAFDAKEMMMLTMMKYTILFAYTNLFFFSFCHMYFIQLVECADSWALNGHWTKVEITKTTLAWTRKKHWLMWTRAVSAWAYSKWAIN